MFRFKEFSLLSWDLWPSVKLPRDRDVVVVTGPNGSGKTTLLDAIRQLLNAPKLSTRRTVQRYLRRPGRTALLRAVVSNLALDGGGRPFAAERIFSDEATVACARVPATGGAPEKRFVVRPDRVPAEELQRIFLSTKDWVGPEQYDRILARAGLTRSLHGLLALEQGKTNALFDLTPHELFRRVLEMLGDQAVLDRYRDARKAHRRCLEELQEQIRGLDFLRVKLDSLRDEVEKLRQWEETRDRVEDLRRRVPAAELQQALADLRDMRAKLPEMRTKVKRGETEAQRLAAELRAAETAEGAAKGALDEANHATEVAQERLGEAKTRLKAADEQIGRLIEDKAQADALPPRDRETLASDERDAWRVLSAAEAQETAARDEVVAWRERIERLRAGKSVYPTAVARTTSALEAERIPFQLLADLVEVAEPALGPAAEAALGDARFALLVAPTDERCVIELARANAFPGPVFVGARQPGEKTCGPLRLAMGAPGWIDAWTRRTRLAEDGSWRDERGTWTHPAGERVLGEVGREAALADAERRVTEAEHRLAEAGAAHLGAEVRLEQISRQIGEEEQRQQLLQRVATLADAQEARRLADATLAEALAAADAARTRRDAAQGTFQQANTRRGEIQKERDVKSSQFEGERRALDELETKAVEAERVIAARRSQVAPELASLAERGELDAPGSVRLDLEKAERGFAALPPPPPPEVRHEEQATAANVKDAQAHVLARQKETEGAEAELTECRRRYAEVVREALHDYRDRILALARLAEVEADVRLPSSLDDDQALDEAGIEVAFGFDGKDMLPLGDSDYSGGQQVIAALILLMAMAEAEGRGFFMLDEPFAHLSVDRIDDVGQFLRASRAQFLLTAPTTLDRQQLDPAALLIVLRKKKPGEAAAPEPLVAERR